MNKSIVRILYSLIENYSSVSPNEGCLAAVFIDDTTIEISALKSGSKFYVSWEVIEFENIKSIQTGSVEVSTFEPFYVNVSPINPDKSMLFFNYKHKQEYTGYSASFVNEGAIQNSNTIQFVCSLPTAYIYYQLVEFN